MHNQTSTIGQARTSRRRPRRLPTVERLEGRALMSYAGGIDLSFGTGGYQPGAPLLTTTTASVLQPDGKLVVVGTGRDAPASGGFTFDFLVSRYNADGTIDTTFGTGGTFSNPALSTQNQLLDYTGIDSGEAVALQPNGDIVVAGEVRTTAVVVRLTPNGALDPTFGTGGIVDLGTQSDGTFRVSLAEGLALLPGGAIAVGGAFEPGNVFVQEPAVQVLNANGSPDVAFNGGNPALVPIPAGAMSFPTLDPQNGSESLPGDSIPIVMTAQADGSVLIGASAVISPVSAPYQQTEIVITRFNPGGALDPTYGTAGQAVISPQAIFPGASSSEVSTLAVQADGKLVVGGSVLIGQETDSSLGPQPQLVALRLGTNGQLDTSFGVGGLIILTGTGSRDTIADGEAIEPDGKIVLVTSDNFAAEFLRLGTNGLPDPEFGVGGRSFIASAGGQDIRGAGTLAIRPNGKILAISGNGLIQLLGSGAVDDFDNDGLSDPAIFDTATGQFRFLASATRTVTTLPFGPAGVGQALPAPGAYNGGGNSEVAFYLPAYGAFINLLPNFSYGPTTFLGIPGAGNSIPAPGDYDGSGTTEYAVYDPAYGAFDYRPAAGGPDVVVPYGQPGAGNSIPVPGDYFGTGTTDFAVYLVNFGAYAILNPATGQSDLIPFGFPGQGNVIPVPGDYDGSGQTELAVYVPQYATFVYRPANGGPDVAIPFGLPGAGVTLPEPGDYDGSGKTEAAAYFPNTGQFAFRPANGGPDVIFNFGVPGQTIPYALASATDAAAGSSGGFGGDAITLRAASVEIPLTPDVLDQLEGTPAKKATKQA